jgi:hypothetical protein
MIIIIIFLIPTPRSKFLPEKLIVKKFSTFYGNHGFITAFTISRLLSHISAKGIQSKPLHLTS